MSSLPVTNTFSSWWGLIQASVPTDKCCEVCHKMRTTCRTTNGAASAAIQQGGEIQGPHRTVVLTDPHKTKIKPTEPFTSLEMMGATVKETVWGVKCGVTACLPLPLFRAFPSVSRFYGPLVGGVSWGFLGHFSIQLGKSHLPDS